MGKRYTIGLDYGTESLRAVLVDIDTGEIAASSIYSYPDSVIDRSLPTTSNHLPKDWALQNPNDWLNGLQETIQMVMHSSGVEKEAVIGLGVDFTACTILPTTAEGQPLCLLPGFRDQPHAWPKLWKHHAAQNQADRVNHLAMERQEGWLSLYGGKISSEWAIPKALQIYEEASDVYEATSYFVEGADWVTWLLTGRLVRNACGAGYKATWNKTNGYPSSDFLEELKPGFGNLFSHKFTGPVIAPGSVSGFLTSLWAERLGLCAGIPVAVGIIDAHSAAIGAGVTQPGVMFMMMGTSTCHMLVAEKEIYVPGISGVVEDGIVPGLFGYEAGQAGVGDIFAWFTETIIPAVYHNSAVERGISLHDILSEKASVLSPGESGLLALDWWNGCRTPLVNANLSGLLIGATIATTPEEIYRALIEATAFGTRLIIETFVENGIAIDRILAGGGLTKNSFLMQIYADITERQIGVLDAHEISALGAAMLAAVAADSSNGDSANLSGIVRTMTPPIVKNYIPGQTSFVIYRRLYAEYQRLVEYFGSQNFVMETLREIRKYSETHTNKGALSII